MLFQYHLKLSITCTYIILENIKYNLIFNKLDFNCRTLFYISLLLHRNLSVVKELYHFEVVRRLSYEIMKLKFYTITSSYLEELWKIICAVIAKETKITFLRPKQIMMYSDVYSNHDVLYFINFEHFLAITARPSVLRAKNY